MTSEPHPEDRVSMLSVEQCRPEVIAFAILMEQQLRANDHKPGWKNDQPEELYRRMNEESHELWKPLHQKHIYGPWTASQIGGEAADVANFAMMIADVCGALPCHRSLSRSAGGEVTPSPINDGNIIYRGDEWVPLCAYQEAMEGWKAANAALTDQAQGEVEKAS